jgi:uncharacterized membrane protein
MQPAAIPPNARAVALQRGLTFGLAQTAIAVSILLLNTFVNTNSGLALLLAAVNFLLSLTAYFGAGILASRQTGQLSTGTFAGLWTGVCYGVLNFIISLIIFLLVTFPKTLVILSTSSDFAGNPDAVRLGVIVGGIGIELFGSLLAIGLGAGLGALGGLIGRSSSPLQPVSVPPPAYPPLPSPPFSGQPPASRPAPDQPGDQPYMEQPH